MIAIVDYGMGNLRNVQKGLEIAGFKARIIQSAEEIRKADGVVLPGVGAFGKAMDNLRALGLIEAIKEVIEEGKPFLGICLGLQLLFSESEEGGLFKGLDIIRGRVVKFFQSRITSPGSRIASVKSSKLKVPHMGWNDLKILKPIPILRGIPDGARMYFVHSYYGEPEDKGIIAATSEYGLEFPAVLARGNLFAVQFHPCKSSQLGLRILNNFAQLTLK